MDAPNRYLQAAALRLIADRIEHADRSLSPTLRDALGEELEAHPEDKRELETIGDLPDWHRDLLDQRLATIDKIGAKPWRKMISAIREDLRKR